MDENNMSNEQRVWMSLSSGGNAGASTLLPKLMREIMEALRDENEEGEEEEITFPSNYEWRTGLYLKLLARQRARMEEGEEEPALQVMEDDPLLGGAKEVLHDWNIIPAKDKKAPFCAPDAARLLAKKNLVGGPGPITWTVGDIAKAGRLLCMPPQPTTYTDEQEMRRVYTLIYDVYRYKNILGQALKDVAFFLEHPELTSCASRVWLLLYDLYHRSFKKRNARNAAIAEDLFDEAGLQNAENILWDERVRLAASVARLRIKHSALKLSQLLPHHLRDEKVAAHGSVAPVSCWVNTKKVKNPEDVVTSIEKVLKMKLIDRLDILEANCFKWDAHCPQFIIFHPSVRTRLAQSTLIQKHKLIVQDRSFCLGPATFGKLISDLHLSGTVIQSHVNSPRTTAYLASLLSQNDNIKKLLAFSAGARKKEYESYFNDLGLKNILIFSEKLIDVPPDSNSLEEVIAVFATPPNSYSAVADPIDLVCSRGGDLSMLEILTESEDTPEGRKRVAGILEEQKKTLKFAMSRPQIQFVLYETHSEIDAENDQMVQKTVNEINKCARLHHAAIQGKLRQIQAIEEAEEREINNNLLSAASTKSRLQVPEEEEGLQTDRSVSQSAFSEQKTKLLSNIVVPDCDIFSVPTIPELCPSVDACLKLATEGCYLALLQRKQVTRMDNKYMIEMAESRGLFGNEASGKKVSKAHKKKVEHAAPPPVKMRKRIKDIEFDRIAAPTMSSACRARRTSKQSMPECQKHLEQQKVPQTRRWWTETTRHIANLRTSLSKQRILPPVEPPRQHQAAGATAAKGFVHSLMRRTQRVDEIVAKSAAVSGAIPVYPRLRLTRLGDKHERKVAIPVHVTMVTFPTPIYPPGYDHW